MNKLIIIGNLTRDPESRDVNGDTVCTFTVAVNRRVKQGAHPQADFVRVSVWGKLGELCHQYLAKGRKVMVEGPVRATAYVANNGDARASLEMTGNSVEFLTSKAEAAAQGTQGVQDSGGDGADVAEYDDEDLPF